MSSQVCKAGLDIPNIERLQVWFRGRCTVRCFDFKALRVSYAAIMVVYNSTRGGSSLDFCSAVMQGLAPDGGLYVPSEIPKVTSANSGILARVCAQDVGNDPIPFEVLALEIFKWYVTKEDIPENDLAELCKKSFETFAHPEVVPLVNVGKDEDISVLELFHGPTFAFKDVALQFLGNLFGYILKNKAGAPKKLTVLGATSGDTGSAAIYGLMGKPNIEVYILHPNGKVAEIQERQMTTVLDDNVHNIAVNGTFDDCQSIVKELFRDKEFKQKHCLGAVNSINWARILAQIVYYFYAYLQYRQKNGSPNSLELIFFCPDWKFR